MAEVAVIPADTAARLATAAELFREYAAGLPFSLCFQGFDAEVASLPGRYGPPSGRLLLAMVGDEAVGCVAFRAIDALAGDPAPVCEMKRLFVKPGARGLGVGRLLCERLLAEARAGGYAMMKLDTEPDFGRGGGAVRVAGVHNDRTVQRRPAPADRLLRPAAVKPRVTAPRSHRRRRRTGCRRVGRCRRPAARR